MRGHSGSYDRMAFFLRLLVSSLIPLLDSGCHEDAAGLAVITHVAMESE